VVALLELLQKTTDHDFMNDKPELFRLCITRIQMEKLPMVIHTALNEARMKISSTDTMVDLTQTLLAALNRYVGMKPPKGSTAKLEAARHGSQPQGAAAYPIFPPQLARLRHRPPHHREMEGVIEITKIKRGVNGVKKVGIEVPAEVEIREEKTGRRIPKTGIERNQAL
jgi:hypothetical protein